MTFDKAFQEIDEIQTREGAPLGDHILKLTEELGEISESYLMLKEYKKPKSEKAVEELHLAEEAIDSIIVGMAILSCITQTAKNDFPLNFVQETLKEKIGKWRSNLAENSQ